MRLVLIWDSVQTEGLVQVRAMKTHIKSENIFNKHTEKQTYDEMTFEMYSTYTRQQIGFQFNQIYLFINEFLNKFTWSWPRILPNCSSFMSNYREYENGFYEIMDFRIGFNFFFIKVIDMCFVSIWQLFGLR
jgi:hypothetical protein